jgi:hypothetical protein
MADDSSKPTGLADGDAGATPEPVSDDETTAGRGEERERAERGLTDFVRRAVSAGVGAATRSKDDIMRAAATEMRAWLEHMNINEEVVKALSKMVIEVKTEIRFRPAEDGRLVTESANDVKIKPGR